MTRIDETAVMWKETGDKIAVLIIASGTFCELNPVGSEIWKLLAAGNDTAEIVRKMAEKYDVPDKKLSKDVKNFISEMVSQGLLRKD